MFADSLAAKVFGFWYPTSWGEGETPKLDRIELKGHNVYQVSCPAAGHNFVVEFIECSSDRLVYSRVIQAFKNKYTAREWCISKMEWMDETKTKKFFKDFALLKKKIDAFVFEDLLECLVVPDGKTPSEVAEWYATDIMENSTQYGNGPFVIGLQPGKWDVASIKEYDHDRGGLTMTDPKHPEGRDFALTYRVQPWAEILRLPEKLFHAADTSFVLQAMKTQNSMGWTWRRISHQETYCK